MHQVAVAVAQQLHLYMARALDEAFQQHPGVAKRGLRLGLGGGQLGGHVLGPLHPAHALAATARAGLDEEWKADARRLLLQPLHALVIAVVAGNAGHARRAGDALALDLRAHGGNGLRMRADEGEARTGAGFDQRQPLGQKAIAGVDGLRARLQRSADHGIGIQVRLRRRSRADAHGLVGLAHVACAGVGLGIHRHRPDAQTTAGADDPAGDLPPVGNEDFFKHGGASHIRYTGLCPSKRGVLSSANCRQIPSTSRVCAGSMMPSSHSRAVA